MSNREKQWDIIKAEYKAHSMSKEGVEKMKENIKKAEFENRIERRHSILKLSLAAVAAMFIIITVLPNTSANVAYAMSRIPILSKWVEVVTFRDYQYEDGRNTADITIPQLLPQISSENNTETDSTADNSNVDSALDNAETNSADSTNSGTLTETPDNAVVQENLQKTADEINAEIQSITEKLIQEFEENLKYEEGYQEMLVKSEVIATTQKYFTLKLICYQAAGSGAEWNYFYTIDLESGERLQLADLFTEGSDYITIISDNIKEQMKKQMAADENVIYWLDSDIPEWDFDKITDETGFYMNENGDIVINFNEGDVAPMYMGCVEFIIPSEVLADIRLYDDYNVTK